METKTFIDLCNEEKKKPSPYQLFIEEVAELTGRKPSTVRLWILENKTPDRLIQRTLSNHFGIPMEELFPPKK